jgi:hypothetical protein
MMDIAAEQQTAQLPSSPSYSKPLVTARVTETTSEQEVIGTNDLLVIGPKPLEVIGGMEDDYVTLLSCQEPVEAVEVWRWGWQIRSLADGSLPEQSSCKAPVKESGDEVP